MPLEFTSLGGFTGSIFSGSFLNDRDTSLFLTSQSVDLFFGYSPRDVTELSVYDSSDNFISWSLLDQDKVFNHVTLTYIDALNNPQSYTYNELDSQFIIFKSKEILINLINDLSASGITDGTFKLSYVFSREMAGSPDNHLVINDISPSRTEIKLLPKGTNNIPYTAFCFKKFPISDISSILLSITQNCPYDQIYKQMFDQYQNSIQFLQTIFFLNDDGSTITFLRHLYEDFIKYTSLSQTQINLGLDSTRIYRIQGIKSYFNNYLLQGYNVIADFNDIESQFNSFVNIRIEQAFSQYKDQKSQDYKNAKQFCFDFFSKFFYAAAVHPIQTIHQNKYFSYFKNVLNFGNTKYFPILTHDFLDERSSPNDPLTLVIKLGSALPIDISIKDECWVSNFGMTPFIFTVILQNPIKFKTLTIGPPNFGTPTKFINKQNINKLYSSDDLNLSDDTTNNVILNKNISKLNTDFSDFNNFIVFSSVATRINIFKNKSISYYNLSSSLSIVNTKYINSLSSSIVYPYYLTEQQNIQSQINDLVGSFDAYESYLFNSGNYVYSPDSKSFINTGFIENYDDSASFYDKYNRDNLINNTPDYISVNSNNQDYLTFLTMVGHHFDNIYTYIGAMPIEKQVKNQVSSSLPTNTLKELLYSFGWNVDDIINSLNIDQVYLNSLNGLTYNILSAQERLKIIWNRILITLPGIYKTKGTETCVKYLMSCYGLPSSLINIREYGGTDSSQDPTPTYQLDEKTYMLRFSGISDRIEGPFPLNTQTVEFKFAIESASYYQDYQRISLFTLHPYLQSQAAWSIDIYKVPGEFTGKIAFQMKSGSTGATITSSALPIFNGEIFNVMLRRNNVNSEFESSSDPDVIPIQYDLVVKRNENGRTIFNSTSSAIFYTQDNRIFSQFGRFSLSDGNYIGMLDKLNIWSIPLDDGDFEGHVNDLNSYGYSGSIAFQDLWVRLNWDYPANVNTGSPSAYWVDNKSNYYHIPNYRTSTWISSSIISTTYSQSQQIIQTAWQSFYPTGSVDIIALNFPYIIDPNWSASFDGCNFISNSVYPFSFREFEYQQDLDGSKYGPNKFKNKKIRKLDYEIDSRFDSHNRSTFESNVTVTGESNQLGFFIDPQDSKNKDIIRYVGRDGIMNLIGDPRNLYSDKYYDLINKNYEYNSLGGKRTLFNEMLTIYKFYFDKSIFEAIKNIVPARANLFTGVVIEPTILERPKYQNKPIISEVTQSRYNDGIIKNIEHLTMSVLWGNFSNTFIGYSQSIDLTDINNAKREYSNNINMGYVTDFMDDIQFGVYPDAEYFQRLWTIPGMDPVANLNSSVPIYGSVSRENPFDNYQILPDPGVPARVPPDTYPNPFFSGFNHNSHSAVYYMMKVWDKHDYFFKTGPYSHDENPLNDTYNSASYYLYKYIIVDEFYFRSLVYLGDLLNNVGYNPSDISYTFFGGNYFHKSNTFFNTPDQRVNNIYAIPGLTPTSFTLGIRPTKQYFELIRGYPRNHYTHKIEKFSKTKYAKFNSINLNTIYIKGRNTIDDTININGINNGTYPVSSNNVSNVNVVNSGNVIQFVPSTNAGTVIPGARATTTSTTTGGGTKSGTPTGGSPGGTPVGGTTGGGKPPPPGGGSGCLIAGTQIRMANGTTKNVENIQIGDILVGYPNLSVTVRELKPNRCNEYYIINNRLKITWEHPVMVNKRLRMVKNLHIGDNMIKYDGTSEIITSIIIINGEIPTYNFIVDKNHLYIADDIVVHNPLFQKP